MRWQIKYWLYIGLFMVFVQIVVGGITRLTGSGLSITKWEIVTGTIPPLSADAWNEAFDLYKETPQYKKINDGMSMKAFKVIYFWEYIHRLWARMMGLVFIVPFILFVRKKWIARPFMRQLLKVVVLAAVVASFGWIMVASGLVDRPWVNAYKLTVHLSLGTILFLYLGYVTFNYSLQNKVVSTRSVYPIVILLVLTFIQLMFGGLMSGMKAALFYPTWPQIDGSWYPEIIGDANAWRLDNLTSYDTNAFAPALIQFIHRMLAYLIYVVVTYFTIKNISERYNIIGNIALLFVLNLQVLLGIFTLLNTKGRIPVTLGVAHQAVGVLLLLSMVWLLVKTKGIKHVIR